MNDATGIPAAAGPALLERVLVADDDRVTRMALAHVLESEGFDVVSVSDGLQVQAELLRETPPQIVVLDWMMPGLTGPELCLWIRSQARLRTCYVILVTARDTVDDLVEGLASGADDFVAKPFNRGELVARVRSGHRVARLQSQLAAKVAELETTLAEVRQLRGLIPICMHCHSIRSGAEHWQKLEGYIEQHSEATFSHSICESCLAKHYPEAPLDDASQEAV